VDLVPGFQKLLQGLSPAMTAPWFASLCTLVSGWMFSGQGIVTRMIVAAGSGAAADRRRRGLEGGRGQKAFS
jgi:hypothetical protein